MTNVGPSMSFSTHAAVRRHEVYWHQGVRSKRARKEEDADEGGGQKVF